MWDITCTLIRIIRRENITVYCLLWTLLMVCMKGNLTLGFINWSWNTVNAIWASSLTWKLRIFRVIRLQVCAVCEGEQNEEKTGISESGKIKFYVMHVPNDIYMWQKGKQIFQLKDYGAQWRRPMWNVVSSWRLFCFCNHRDGYECRHFMWLVSIFEVSVFVLYARSLQPVCIVNVATCQQNEKMCSINKSFLYVCDDGILL